jgi:hypothetical protein
MKDFIGIYPNAMPDDTCDLIIDWFENNIDIQQPGIVSSRQGEKTEVVKNVKDSTDIPVYFSDDELPNYHIALAISKGISPYKDEYFHLNEGPRWDVVNTYNLQRYYPGQGFHIPHHEYNPTSNQLLLAWMIYLNDVTEGGETRFVYQDINIEPKKGTLVIWPAYFTHVHHGLVSATQTKYIATGWHRYYA